MSMREATALQEMLIVAAVCHHLVLGDGEAVLETGDDQRVPSGVSLSAFGLFS